MATTKIPLRQRSSLFAQSQAIRSTFLGWSKPILHSACDFLQLQYTRGHYWDMDRCLLVLPGSFAGRKLTQLMAVRAKEQSLVLRPPELLTLGTLPEKLYSAKWPFASDLEQVLAWTKVLRQADRDMLTPLLFSVPDSSDLRPWMDLARILSSLHRELASDLVDFDDVATELKGTAEEVRWNILAKVQRAYLDELHTAGLWDVQSARRFAIDHQEVQTDREIILVGAVDLNQAQRRFLSQVAENVHVLVGAPTSYASGFSDDGTLVPDYWQDIEIPIEESQLHVRSTAEDAANELASQLADLGSSYSVRDITLGIPDAKIVPALQETLGRVGIPLRYGPGTSVIQSPPMHLIELLGEYLDDGSIDIFNSFIRLPSIYDWLQRSFHGGESPAFSTDFLAKVDSYIESTLLRSVNVPEWPEGANKAIVLQVVERLESLLKPLRMIHANLSEWSAPLRNVLSELYQNVQLDSQDVSGNITLRACSEINEALTKLSELPKNLDAVATFQETMTWLHNQLETTNVPPIVDESAIEMLGWLELTLDDAPVLMLTGMHDGIVPESVNGDAFLPNQLRSSLGLMDNARRYARDAYAMLAMLHTREHLELVLNHLSLDGDPQTPSRLLLAVPSDLLARRVKLLLNPKETSLGQRIASTWVPQQLQTAIPIPVPRSDAVVRDMAVTDFKKYDQCPYRFYLNRIEKARPFEHERLELDGGGFGDLLHICLEGLFDSPVASSTDSDAIAAWLSDHLKATARKRFGVSLSPALQIQLEQAERRLAAFAVHQAAQAAAGWRILHIEHQVSKTDGISLDIDDKPMIVHGRIDRIDFHEADGRYAVWDYKTGDRAGKPTEAHLKQNGTWTDWQLPLYGLLIQTLGIKDLSQVQFGYILLPKNPVDTQFIVADFTEEQHKAALESAKVLARNVMNGVFWPPKYKSIPVEDDYSAITQLPVVRRWNESLVTTEASPQSETVASPTSEESTSKSAKESNEASGAKGELKDAINTRPKRSEKPPTKLQLEVHRASGDADPDWFTPQMILASAGTGKTYSLASRAVRLLFTDQELDSILATTFTRKAAGEILHRVLSWLADAVEDQSGFDRLAIVLHPLEITRDTVRYQLGRLCSHLHRFRVSTLDSFYSQLARSFALELKMPPGWTLSDTFQSEQIQHEAVSRMFDTMDRAALRSLVSQLSKGDAGRSIRREIENVVASGYELFRKTTEEAWNQLHVPTGPKPEQVDAALTAFQASHVEHKSYPNARNKLIEKFQSCQWTEFLGQTLVRNCDKEVPKYYSKELPAQTVGALEILAKKAAVEELASRRAQNEAAFRLLQNYHQQLEWVKSRNRIVTFDDIAERLSSWMQETVGKYRNKEDQTQKGTATQESKPADATSHDADSAKPDTTDLKSIAYRLDCPVNHLLLDEFQDTSPMQWNIIKPFAEAIVQGSAKTNSFFCVGDSKQAIYSWRGGVSEIFESVGKQIDRVRQEKLVKSFRSSPVVIQFVNDVFTQLAKHPKFYNEDEEDSETMDNTTVSDWIDRYFTQHETSKTNLPGFVEFRNANCDKNKDSNGEESSVGLLDEVADRIEQLHKTSPRIEIGVLTRTNRDVGKVIGLLRDRGVDASQEGGNPLVDSSAVLLLLSAMKLANHPSDSLAYFHVMHSPLAELLPKESSSNAIILSAFLREKIDSFGFGRMLGDFANSLANYCVERDQDRLKQLIQLGYRFDGMRSRQIHDFVAFVEREKVSMPGMSPVRVMTIHQSKGLEFDAVFLPTLDQTIVSRAPTFVPMYVDRTKPPIGVLKYMNRDVQKYLADSWKIAFREYANQQLAEALCVFYVAMTRARQALYLYTSPSSSPKKCWGSVLHSVFATQGQSEQPGIVVRSFGDSNWHEVLEESRRQTEAAELATKQTMAAVPKSFPELSVTGQLGKRTIQLRRVTKGTQNLSWLSPSRSTEPKMVDLASKWTEIDSTGAVVGKLVHRWFEEIRGWIQDFKLSKKRLKDLAASTLTQEEMGQIKINAWVDRFMQYCEMPSVLRALSADRYDSWHKPRMLRLEVTNERRLLQIMDDQMLRGVIDRCVLGCDGDRVVRAEILDFKTDSKPESLSNEDWAKDRIAHHGKQLGYYRRVLCEQFKLHPNDIRTTLLLLGEDLEVNVPNG